MRTYSAISAVMALAIASVVSAAPLHFTATDLGGLGGSLGSRGFGISATNLVAGTGWTSGNAALNALTFEDMGAGGVARTTYGPLASGSTNSSYSMGIGGPAGDTIVGFATAAGRTIHAIAAVGGVETDLHSTIAASASFSGSTNSRALGINNNGDVVGQARVGSAYTAFYLPSGGSAAAIPLIASTTSTDSIAMSVNDNGVVVGFDYSGNWNFGLEGSLGGGVTHPQAFSWAGGSATPLGALGTGTDSIATAINSAGTIVGQATSSATDMINTQGHAFVFSGGMMTALAELSGATMSIADDINDAGDIVGTVKTATGSKAFLYHAGQMIDLNTLISATGWVLKEADSINDDGYITGYGTHNGVTTAFILSPVAGASVPEPASAVLLGMGCLGLLARRQRA